MAQYSDQDLLGMISQNPSDAEGASYFDRFIDWVASPWMPDPDDIVEPNYEAFVDQVFDQATQEAEAAEQWGAAGDTGFPTLPPFPGEQPGGGTFPGAPAPDYGTQFAGPMDPAQSGVSQYLYKIAAQIMRSGITGQALAALARILMGKARGTEITPSCAKIMADQLTDPQRQAVYQFLCGMRAPMGLSQQGQQTFLAIKLATAGLPPQHCGCS